MNIKIIIRSIFIPLEKRLFGVIVILAMHYCNIKLKHNQTITHTHTPTHTHTHTHTHKGCHPKKLCIFVMKVILNTKEHTHTDNYTLVVTLISDSLKVLDINLYSLGSSL